MNDTDSIQHRRTQHTHGDGFGYDTEGNRVPIVSFDYDAVESAKRVAEDSTAITRDDLARIAIESKAIFEARLHQLLTEDDPEPEEIGRRYLMFRYYQNPTNMKTLGKAMGGLCEERARQLFKKFVLKFGKNLGWFRSINTMVL